MSDISDIPKLYTALAEWAACMIYVILLKKRFRVKSLRFWLFSGLTLAFFLAVYIGLDFLQSYFLIPGMIVAIAGIFLTIYLLCDLKMIEAVFWAARVFILAEFVASLEWQAYFYFAQTFSVLGHTAFQYMFVALIYGGIFTAIFLLEKRYASGNLHLGFRAKEVILSAVISIGMFLLSNISFIFPGSPLSGQSSSEIFYIRTLVDFCALILLFSQQESRRWRYNKLELDSVRKILSRQYEQYCASRDNIEYLNRKYHDFKQQIEVIEIEENSERRAEYLRDLKKAIRIYKTQNDSGNIVLDTILTGKSHDCLESNINFTCVADGALLEFMDATDICSIVGNALDNAIESVRQLKQAEKRLIKMAVYSQNGSLVLRFENYSENRLNFDKGLPITTKANKTDHGYGIKSIKYSVEKYSGSIDISMNDNWFVLCILIPLADGLESDQKSQALI